MIGTGAVHALAASATPEVSAANNDGNFNAHLADLGNLVTDLADFIEVKAELAVSRQGFTADFQHHAFVLWLFHNPIPFPIRTIIYQKIKKCNTNIKKEGTEVHSFCSQF